MSVTVSSPSVNVIVADELVTVKTGTLAAQWGLITGTLSNQTDLQDELDLKADLESPVFTGDPTAPTPLSTDNSTSIATTAFVNSVGFISTEAADLAYQPKSTVLTGLAAKTVPDGALVGTTDSQILTNKTLTGATISQITNTGTLTLPTSTDTLVGRATTDTLTNKTLTAPVISTINNSGILTLPSGPDTLVGRATTDTLTNKTVDLTSNTLVATSLQLKDSISDETGSGALVFGTSPTIGTPTISAPTVTGSASIDAITWDTTPSVSAGVAVMRWNDTDGTIDLGLKGGNVTLQMGQEIVLRVINASGGDILNGKVVRISGADSGFPTIEKAIADGSSSAFDILGMTTEDIDNGAYGYVTIQGIVRSLNTTAIADGTVVYIDPDTAGEFTTTKPTAPDQIIIMGYVITGNDALDGSVYVKVNGGFQIDELSDVIVDTPTDGQILRFESATGVWENYTKDLFSKKASDEGVTNSTSLIDCANISISLAANAIYRVTASLTIDVASGGNTCSAKFVLPTSATTASKWMIDDATTLKTSTSDITAQTAILTTNAPVSATLVNDFVVTTAASAGTLKLQFAQGTSNANTVTIKAGSWIYAVRVD